MTKGTYKKIEIRKSYLFAATPSHAREGGGGGVVATNYDEKQRVTIVKQRQCDLLSNVVSYSWSFGLLKSRLSAI